MAELELRHPTTRLSIHLTTHERGQMSWKLSVSNTSVTKNLPACLILPLVLRTHSGELMKMSQATLKKFLSLTFLFRNDV